MKHKENIIMVIIVSFCFLALSNVLFVSKQNNQKSQAVAGNNDNETFYESHVNITTVISPQVNCNEGIFIEDHARELYVEELESNIRANILTYVIVQDCTVSIGQFEPSIGPITQDSQTSTTVGVTLFIDGCKQLSAQEMNTISEIIRGIIDIKPENIEITVNGM